MSLERLVEEIRLRAERELEEARLRTDGEESAIRAESDRRVRQLTDDGRRLAESEAARERAQKVASAKLQARKLVYEAREKKTGEMLDGVREALRDYTESSEYPLVLKRMFSLAQERLGKQIRVKGREEDASLLKGIVGKNFESTPVPVLGGLVAETPDGARRLNLSFDELLRLREDEVRSLLAP